MLTPRYFFTDDFSHLHDYFLTQPHSKRSFQKGEYLWEPGRPFEAIHYIVSGLAQNYVEHENGHRKILSFHGSGTVFPGYHQNDYRIERAIITRAIGAVEVLEFTKDQFRLMFEANAMLSAAVVEWFSMYVNLLLYDSAHQEYNSSFIKLCNLLYLLYSREAKNSCGIGDLTQDDLSAILGVSRVNLTRGLTLLRNEGIIVTHRKCIEVVDQAGLAAYCSLETV